MSKMSQYPSIDDPNSFTAEQKDYFLGTASCLSTGLKGQNSAAVTANIPLSDIVPSPGSNEHRGDVLTVNSSDEVVWAPPAGGLPAYTSSEAGKVLAVNSQGNGVEWISAGGGGGGSSQLEVVDFVCEYDTDYNLNLIRKSKTANEIIAMINSGKQVCARIVVFNTNGNVKEEISYPLCYFYYSDGIYPTLFFNWGEGSGGDSRNSIISEDTDENTWNGPWFNAPA